KNETTCQTFTKENLAQGVITTSRLISNDDEVFFAGFGKDDNGLENGNSVGNITRNFKRTIFFELNKWNVRTSEQKSDRMNELWAFVKTPRMELKGINVNSYASPDGELKLNQNLTDKRSESTYSFLFKELKGLKLGVDQSNLYKRQAMEEDWAGLKRLVAASNLADKAEALQIINSSKSNDDKEADLRKLASWQTILDEIMPELRRSDVQLQGKIANRSVTELAELAKTSYADFNTKELLIYAASSKDLKVKKDAYKAFIKAKPKSIIGYNNLAACLILEGDLNGAEKQLDLAKAECGDNDSLYKNYGVVLRRNGNTDEAASAYSRAAKAGISTGYNQAIIDVINGDYSAASTNMPSNACGGNAALVAMLSGNVSSAGDKVKCDNNITALEYYVAAVAFARQKNIEYMAVYLKSAIDKDKSLADKATNDLEFSSYWDSAEFKNAVNH
ncbi:MAG: hypothetical protein KDC92_16915, partial [Bacteroidetes bacterium]|nr:hypothetical protein [Bacteroidota bacterium]